MVSLRRRRLLGLCTGISPDSVQLPTLSDSGNASENPVAVHPVPSVDLDQAKEENSSKSCPGSSNVSGSSSVKEEPNQQFSGVSGEQVHGQELKRRKRHRRKQFDDSEPCIMRGVYFKNMKWQAAIKVDKKQIHLGTVGSQEEAAHLYDRAAFMCGREPNFELPEKEKQELSQLKWDEFLTMTRNAITSKKHQRRLRAGSHKKSETPLQSGDMDVDQGASYSGSDDAEPETSVS